MSAFEMDLETKSMIRRVVFALGLTIVTCATIFVSAFAVNGNFRSSVFFSPALQGLFADELSLHQQALVKTNKVLKAKESQPQIRRTNQLASQPAALPVAFQSVDHSKPLTAGQREVARFISKRYRVSRQAIESMVRVAWQVGREERVDPTLILAISGIESSYNPFAASSVGAKGLMQVMAHIHKDKFEALSPGDWNPLNPELNMRVGSKIIREYTRRAGSVRDGLRWYVGAAIHGNDGGYPDKVLGLKARIDAAYSRGSVMANKQGATQNT